MSDTVLASSLSKSDPTSADWWKRAEAAATKMLGAWVDSGEFITGCQALLKSNAKLRECSLVSWGSALFQCATLGLRPFGARGQCWIVPYKAVATFQMGAYGYIDLAARAGFKMWAERVYHGDKFEARSGSHPELLHIPKLRTESDGKRLIATYACARFVDGFTLFRVCDIAEIERRRKRSKAVQAGGSTPWDTDYDSMAVVVALRSLGRQLPIERCDTLRAVATQQEYADAGVMTNDNRPAFMLEADAAAAEVTRDATPGAAEKITRSSASVTVEAKSYDPEMPANRGADEVTESPVTSTGSVVSDAGAGEGKVDTAVSAPPPSGEWFPKGPSKDCIVGQLFFENKEPQKRGKYTVYALDTPDGDVYTTFDKKLSDAIPLKVEVVAAWTEKEKDGKNYKNLAAVKLQ